MDIVVCIKQIPKGEIQIDSSQRGIKEDDLSFDICEFDDYALEAALQMKEKLGGTITAVTIGPERARKTLYLALAKGADTAIQVWDDSLQQLNGYVTAKVLAVLLRTLKFQLVLTGVEAEDDRLGYVGIALARELDLPHVSVVTYMEPLDGGARFKVHREAGGGALQILEVSSPVVLTIQTGSYQPRYATVLRIVQARKKEVKRVTLRDLGLQEELPSTLAKTKVLELFTPPRQKQVQFIEGKSEEVAKKLVDIIKARVGVSP